MRLAIVFPAHDEESRIWPTLDDPRVTFRHFPKLGKGGVIMAYTRMHRIALPPTVARLGISAVQRTIRALADAVVVHEPSFAAIVPGANTVPHGIERIDPKGDRPAVRAELGLDDRLVVLCFGFVAPCKGIEVAADAASLLDGPKRTGSGWQPRAVLPSLVAVGILVGSSAFVLAGSTSPSTLNNVGFRDAARHRAALRSRAGAASTPPARAGGEETLEDRVSGDRAPRS